MTKNDNLLTRETIDSLRIKCQTHLSDMKHSFLSTLLVAMAGATMVYPLPAQDQKIYQRGFLSKEEARKSIEVPAGYELQLVLSDPIIQEPVAVAWDGNGVMYVVEMRTYMQDADATGENKPTSRISRHEDTNGDGVYDKHSVYIDNMVLPRTILPLDDRLMVRVSHTLDLWNYRDTNGDGVADEKIKIHEGGKRGGNMEHQPSGLIWALDNWIYLTYENVRYRFTDGELIKETMPRGCGQWGTSQDDDGRIYYSRAGAEVPAEGFQQNPQYGIISIPGQYSKDFRKVYPIAPVPDVQGGNKRLGPNNGLNYFTGCAGAGIYLGDALPDDLYGNLFIPEPVGRLIRLANVDRSNGTTTLTNATPGSEFIRSRDINFRPLQATTGPDGCLYIVDMHRGIIQQGNWTKPGSYLRSVIDKWGLAKNINRGRIYRLVHKDHKPGPRPQLNSLSSKQLLKYLDHPNAWWRDTAKRLIILKDDRKSVISQLEKAVLNTKVKPQTRITALWTLEGMSATKPELLASLVKDSNHRIVCQAIRVSEAWIKKDNLIVISALNKLANTDDAEISIQLLNSIEYCKNPTSLKNLHTKLMQKHGELPSVIANIKSRNNTKAPRGKNFNAAMNKAMSNGQKIYAQLCTECHGENGKGTPMAGQPGVTLAPALNSKRVTDSEGSLIRILLHGLQGPLDGKTYSAGIMPPQGSHDDQWIADIATYVRNSFGNKGAMVEPNAVANLRKIHSSQQAMWTQSELKALEPRELKNRKSWKLTASHGESSLKFIIDGDARTRYSTDTKMQPDMWLQIELPEDFNIQRIHMDSTKSALDLPSNYNVSFSLDGKKWDTSETHKITGSEASIYIAPTKAKYIRINQLGSSKRYFWSIHELRLFGN